MDFVSPMSATGGLPMRNAVRGSYRVRRVTGTAPVVADTELALEVTPRQPARLGPNCDVLLSHEGVEVARTPGICQLSRDLEFVGVVPVEDAPADQIRVEVTSEGLQVQSAVEGFRWSLEATAL